MSRQRSMEVIEQAEENLTRRYRRVESLERIAQIRRLREQKKTIPEIKEILGCGEPVSYTHMTLPTT